MTGTPLVGRDAALAELDSLLDDARCGRGRVVLVTGEAGIGKTRLAEEAARRAQGFALHWAWCRSDRTLGSLRTWASVLRALASTAPAVTELAEASAPLRGLLAGGTAEGVHPEVARAALAQDVGEAFRRAADRPRLVVLDDAHDAEASSLRLLLDVQPELRGLPVLVLVTARDTGWEDREDLHADLLRLAARVPLGPLTPEEVRRLVPTADDGLVRRTGGNPLLVTELARSEGDVPASLQSMVSARLAALPDATRDVLAAAAVLGPRFRLDVLAEVSGTTGAPHLVPDLVVVSAPGEARFVHELLRDAVYASLPDAERTARHARSAEVLARLRAAGRLVAAAEVAGHLLCSGRDEDAAEACLAAALDAEGRLANEDAAHWAGAALPLLTDPGRRAEAHLLRSRNRRGAGDRDGAREDLLAAAALAQECARADLLADAALGTGAGGFEVDQQDAAQLDLLERALAALPVDDLPRRAAVLARLSVARARIAPANVVEDLAREAVAIGRASGDPIALGVALAALCDAIAGPDHVEERLDHAAEVISLAQQTGDGVLELLGRRLRVMALFELGRREDVEREALAYELRAEVVRHPVYRWYPALWRACWAMAEGRYDECDALLEEALRLGGGSANAELLVAVARWPRFAWTRDVEGLERLSQQFALEQFPDLWARLTEAVVAAKSGRHDTARALLDAVGPRLDELPLDSEWLPALAQAVEAVHEIGGHECEAHLYDLLLPYAELWAVEGIGAAVHGPVHASLARVAPDAEARARHVARARQLLAAVGAAARLAALPGAEAAPAAPDAALRREGEVWAFSWQGRTTRVRDSKGLRDLVVLLGSPAQEVSALDLYGGVLEHDTGELLDATARAAYKERLRELEQAPSLSEAEAAERALLLDQLASAYGLGGRSRRTGSSVERARSAVTARVREAVKRVAEADPDLGRHLQHSVRTGSFCAYAPESPVVWDLTP